MSRRYLLLTNRMLCAILGVPSVPVSLFSDLRAPGNPAVIRYAGTDGQGGTGPDLFSRLSPVTNHSHYTGTHP